MCPHHTHMKCFQRLWHAPATVFQLCAALSRIASKTIFFVCLGFYQPYFEEPYGNIPSRNKCSVLPNRVSNCLAWQLISKTWWANSKYTFRDTHHSGGSLEHSLILSISFSKHAIGSDHNILDMHWQMQRLMKNLFFPLPNILHMIKLLRLLKVLC